MSNPSADRGRDTSQAELLELVSRLQDQTERDAARLASLHDALQTSRQIGVAIGIIMAATRCTADEGFHVLRHASQNGHRKLRDIADEVVLTGAVPVDADRPDLEGPPTLHGGTHPPTDRA